MAERQIKSRQRVVEHGEVFTSEREVKAMCDLAKDEARRIDSRVLEPACGDGNFLAEILERKLKTVTELYKKNKYDIEKYSIVAISSLYGIDILDDNAEECRERLFSIWKKHTSKKVGKYASDNIEESARYIINTNILCGDALTLLKDNGQPIIFSEWNLVAGNLIKRRDYELATLLAMKDKERQGDLFQSSKNTQKEVYAYIPEPIKEYEPIEYWRVQCQN